MITKILKTELKRTKDRNIDICEGSGVSKFALSRFRAKDDYAISIKNAEKLLKYFKYRIVKDRRAGK